MTTAQTVATPTPLDFREYLQTHDRGKDWYEDTIRDALHQGHALRVPGFLVSFIMSHYQVTREVVHLALYQRASAVYPPPLPEPHRQLGWILRRVPAPEGGRGWTTELYRLPDWLLEFLDGCVLYPVPKRVSSMDAIAYISVTCTERGSTGAASSWNWE